MVYCNFLELFGDFPYSYGARADMWFADNLNTR